AIVKQLVEQQGGTVSVKSKEGEGSVFSFALPFKKTNEKIHDEAEVTESLKTVLNNIHVLVVEDIPLNQLLMKTLLEEFGFAMDIAGNGKIAIEKLKKTKYDIILMDLQMPEMDGFETTEYLRKTMKLQTPIIALTADVTTVDVEKCKAIGMNDYISKPVDEKILYNKIIRYLKRSMYEDAATNTEKETHQQKESCINLDYLKRVTKNNASLIAEIIEVYINETPKLIAAMQQALNDKNWEALRTASHAIIPSFSTMGIAKEFESIAKKIQEEAIILRDNFASSDIKKETIARLSESVLKIETVCKQACEELRKELLVIK